MTATYTAAAVAALPTPALLALYNEATGSSTTKFASRAKGVVQTVRALERAGRLLAEEAPVVEQPKAAQRGALLASVVGAFRAHFATGAESVNLKELAPKIGITERTLRQAMDAAKRKGFVFPSLGKCCFGFVDPRSAA